MELLRHVIKGLLKTLYMCLACHFNSMKECCSDSGINHLMSNCGVLQNAIRDFYWNISIMYNAIYKCIFQGRDNFSLDPVPRLVFTSTDCTQTFGGM